jgi:hypothetical protein
MQSNIEEEKSMAEVVTTATAGAQVSGAQGATVTANGTGQYENGTGTNTNGQAAAQGQPAEGQAQTYTAEQMQAEAGRRVQAALERARAGWQNELQSQLENARSEAERLANLSAEQRAAEEQRLAQERFDADRAKFEAERLEFEAGKQLAGMNLPPSFAHFLAGKDAETTKTNIDSFSREWADALQKAVDERLKSEPPKSGGGDQVPANAGFMDIIRQNQR